MDAVIKKTESGPDLVSEVMKLSGVDIRPCLQCKKCSNGCRVARMADAPPSEVIRRLRFGADDSILDCTLVWLCVSCDVCHERCPMRIDMAGVMDALRAISVKRNRKSQQGDVPMFDRFFLRTVKLFGRTYDIGMIAAYKIGSSSYLRDAAKFPAMLFKRKIALFPSLKADKKYTKRIFQR